MANLKHVDSVVDREFRNRINQLIDSVNAQGKSIQDLVAEGQLTEEQYATLIQYVNGLVKSGNVDKSDLTPEFKGEIERFNAQLAQTHYEATRKKTLNDVDEEFLDALVGGEGTSFNLLSIPRDYSVEPVKTTFMDVSYNLFNKDNIIRGRTVTTDGKEIEDDAYWLSDDYIPTTQGDVFSITGGGSPRIATYRENGEFYSRTGTSGGKYTNNSSVVTHFRISDYSDPDNLMVNKGDTPLPYQQYHSTIRRENLPEPEPVIPEKTTFFYKSNNLFNKDNVTLNKSIDSNGEIYTDENRWLSNDLIPIQEGDTFSFDTEHPYRVAQYRENGEFVSRTGPTGGILTITSSVARYMQISGEKANPLNKIMINRGGTLLPYEPYGVFLKNDYLNIDEVDIEVDDLKEDLLNELMSYVDVKNPYPPTIQLEEVHRGSNVPMWLSEDGKVLYGRNGSTRLIMSTDEWVTTSEILTAPRHINAVRELGDGELLFSCNRQDSESIHAKVFKTIGFDRNNPENTEYKQVLNSGSPLANINNSWGMDIYENIVLLLEYGRQGTDGSNYAYLSTDYGDTFTEIFDLKTEVIEGRPPHDEDAHVHTIAYDPYFNRIWLAVGDSANTATYYSDNMGDSWKFVEGSNVVQYTGIIALEDCVIFGSDRNPNGLHIYRRKDKGTPPIINTWYTLNDAETITHIFGLPYQRTRGKDVPVYFFAQPSGGLRSTVLMSFVDGKKAHLIYESAPIFSLYNGAGISVALGDTSQGNIIIAKDMPDESGNTVYKAKAPVWE